jgi:5-hydroxyisourate hydrolase-like protein (transthyretin family)
MWKKLDAFSGLPGGVRGLWQHGVLPGTTTDKDGRFTVAGAGVERLVGLHLSGASIAETELWVANRPGLDPRPYNKATQVNAAMPFGATRWLLDGPAPAVVAEPEKPIRGVVKEKGSGKPRAGVRVRLTRNGNDLVTVQVSATTDEQGRYELRGARKSPKGYMVEVSGDTATGHMACQSRAADTPGFSAITIDVAVRKGVVVTGRMLDGTTRKPLAGYVMVGVLLENPHVKDFPEFSSSASFQSSPTDDEGTFRVVTIPGPVLLMGGPNTMETRYLYKPPMPDPKYPRYFPKERGLGTAYYTYGGAISPLQGNYARVLEIEKGRDVVKQDIVLERASATPVKFVDAEGNPVRGAFIAGISPQDWHYPTRIEKDTCEAYHLEPGKPRLLAVYQPDRKLFGALRLKGDEKGPLVVKLGQGATVKGRLLGDDGQPLAGVTVRLYHLDRTAEEIHRHAHRARSTATAADGSFQIDEVVPGVKFWLHYSRARRELEPVGKKRQEHEGQAGKTADVGDVKVKRDPKGD